MKRLALPLALAVLAGVFAAPAPAEAGGLFLTDRGARPLGRGFAFVAGADDPQALWYNPAGIAWSGQQFLLDATLTFLRTDFTRIDSGGNELPTVQLDATPLPIPMIAYTHPIGDWTLGLGLHAPNAGLLSWPRGVRASGGTCDATTAEGMGDADCEAAPQRYSLYTLEGSSFVNITPAIAWKPIDSLSIGVGMNLLVGSFVGETAISGCDGFLCTQPENPEWDGVARFTLSPIVHPGLTLGATYDAGIVRVGASFVWWPNAVSGDAELDVRLPTAPIFDGAEVDGSKARLELDLPFTVRGGVELRPIRGLRIEAALVWEHWSMQDAAKIEPRDVWIRNAVAIGDYQVGPINIPRQMNDVFSVRLGGQYATWEDRLVISAGVNFENSSFDDAYLTPLTIDSQKWVVGLGAALEVTDGVWLDVSYAHVFLQDRNVTNSQVAQPNPIRPPREDGAPPNASGAAYIGNGRYDIEADIVGVGIRWQIDAPAPRAEEDEAEEPAPVEEEPVATPALAATPEPPSDLDGDGVPDDADECDDTIAGVMVDPLGCPALQDAMTFPGIAFASGGAELTPESIPALEQVLHVLRRHPEVRIQVGGHTDSRGSARHNLRLSTQRARAVAQWLADHGVDPARLDAEGFGETQPVADNQTAEGREQNRRIEFRVVR